MKNQKTLRLVESALCIAIAIVLEMVAKVIPFLNFPNGGTITLVSMLPIIIISYKYGIKWGLLTGFVYSLTEILMGISTVNVAFIQGETFEDGVIWKAILMIFLDYIVAYTILGFGGIFRKKIKNPSIALCLGSIFALLLRFIVHIISGFILFKSWAEWFFNIDYIYNTIGAGILEKFSGDGLVLLYSTCYNGLYMIPEIIFTAIVAIIIGNLPFIKKSFKNS